MVVEVIEIVLEVIEMVIEYTEVIEMNIYIIDVFYRL